MVEPFTLIAAEKVGGAAVEVVAKRLLERARAVPKRGNTADMASEYALIARDTAFALQAEFNRILCEAEWCDLSKGEDVRELGLRVSYYLRVDVLRPVLTEAVSGFEACVNRLRAENYGVLIELFGKGVDKDLVLNKCKEIVENLHKAIEKLSQAFPQDMISGFGAGYLVQIEEFLQEHLDGTAPPRENLISIIKQARQTTAGAFPGLAVSADLDALLKLYS